MLSHGRAGLIRLAQKTPLSFAYKKSAL